MSSSLETRITRRTYDRIARQYEDRRGSSTALIPTIERFTGLLPAGATVLEAGCGTGRDLVLFQEQVGSVIGLDLSESMLEIAREKGGRALVVGDLISLPIEDETFDGCWAAASLLHLPKTAVPDALDEVRRILKGEGKFFICLKEGEDEGLVGEGDMARYFAMYQRDEFEEIAARAGFEIVESWTTPDEAGREPWLNWFLAPRSNV